MRAPTLSQLMISPTRSEMFIRSILNVYVDAVSTTSVLLGVVDNIRGLGILPLPEIFYADVVNCARVVTAALSLLAPPLVTLACRATLNVLAGVGPVPPPVREII